MRNILLLLPFLVLLSGCLYPDEQRNAHQPPDEAQMAVVQQAVETFQESTDGLLPIKTIENPQEFMEYQIDFERLIPTYLGEHPSNAYEAGGIYQYVIVNAETEPQIKIADLQTFEALRSLQLRIQGMGPHVELGEQVGPNVYQLNLDYYNLEENPTVTSPYTGVELDVYYSGGQEWIVDYRPDVMHILQDQSLTFETGDDARAILYAYTPVVPVFSPEITVDENNSPIFMTSRHKNR